MRFLLIGSSRRCRVPRARHDCTSGQWPCANSLILDRAQGMAHSRDRERCLRTQLAKSTIGMGDFDAEEWIAVEVFFPRQDFALSGAEADPAEETRNDA